MSCRHVVVSLTLLGSGCWADFPDSRLAQSRDAFRQPVRDAAVTPDARSVADARRPPGPDLGGAADARPADSGSDALPADASADASVAPCVPGSFLGCSADGRSLRLCQGADQPAQTISCEPSECDPDSGRCTQCDPNTYRTQCLGGIASPNPKVRLCTPVGRVLEVECDGRCIGGTGGGCCTDSDGDGQTACQGDCNGIDARVFSGQTDYFGEADGRGSFDYNCDSVAESEFQGLWRCEAQEDVWRWVDQIPACGERGTISRGGKWIGERCAAVLTKRNELNRCR
jgi:hypothetical protein